MVFLNTIILLHSSLLTVGKMNQFLLVFVEGGNSLNYSGEDLLCVLGACIAVPRHKGCSVSNWHYKQVRAGPLLSTDKT